MVDGALGYGKITIGFSDLLKSFNESTSDIRTTMILVICVAFIFVIIKGAKVFADFRGKSLQTLEVITIHASDNIP